MSYPLMVGLKTIGMIKSTYFLSFSDLNIYLLFFVFLEISLVIWMDKVVAWLCLWEENICTQFKFSWKPIIFFFFYETKWYCLCWVDDLSRFSKLKTCVLELASYVVLFTGMHILMNLEKLNGKDSPQEPEQLLLVQFDLFWSIST